MSREKLRVGTYFIKLVRVLVCICKYTDWRMTLKRSWCWERLKARGEGNDRGWDGWMASPTQWTWVWVNGSWRWTGRPGVLQSMGLQRVGDNWASELKKDSHTAFLTNDKSSHHFFIITPKYALRYFCTCYTSKKNSTIVWEFLSKNM